MKMLSSEDSRNMEICLPKEESTEGQMNQLTNIVVIAFPVLNVMKVENSAHHKASIDVCIVQYVVLVLNG